MMKKERINIYGEINSWGSNSSVAFSERFHEAEASAEEIELHIHSVGGDVFEGSVIYNIIKDSKKRVIAYIDGIAASMASVIMLACDKIYMAENAFVMVHAPSSYLSGNAEDLEKAAKLLRAMEDNFISAYSKRTGKKEEDLREWMQGENWFSAKEALAEKLIDGITDYVEVEEIEEQEEQEIIRRDAQAIIDKYRAKTNRIINTKKDKEMTKEKKAEMIAKFDLQGVTCESSDELIEKAISDKMQEKDDLLAQERHSQVVVKVEQAVIDKKITDKQKESFIEIGDNLGMEKLSAILEDMKPIEVKQTITSQLVKTPNGSQDLRDWDWDRYQKEDPRALERLQREDKEEFDRLYNAKYLTK